MTNKYMFLSLLDRVLINTDTDVIATMAIESNTLDNETALGKFCDRYELGNWFYEAMIMTDIDLGAELSKIVALREQESENQRQIDRDRDESQFGQFAKQTLTL